jgi:hypothetical protein
VVERANNQALAPGPAHERGHAYTIFKGTSIRNKIDFSSCKQSTKKTCN